MCLILCILAMLSMATGCASKQTRDPIKLQAQGSFAAGGRTTTYPGVFSMERFNSPNGQTAYGDHLYAFYQIPAAPRLYPLIFLHGKLQNKRTWETTPDGREGFQNIFLRRGFSTYLVDQPRRGDAGASTEATTITPSFTSRQIYSLCRIGEYPGRYPDVQFPTSTEAFAQFMRQVSPDTGPLNYDIAAEAMAALLKKTGPAILLVHGQGGTIAWRTPFLTDNLRAIVAYEPGGSPFLFPESELPAPVKTAYGEIKPQAVPLYLFKKLTRMPIVLFYGDNIAMEPCPDIGRDQWRGELALAKQFASCVNRHGGHATVIHLPEIGIHGNTHFPFSDLNNVLIADVLSTWLEEHQLDLRN